MAVIRKGIKRARNSVISVPDLNHSSPTYQGNFRLFRSMSFLFNNFILHFTARKLSTITRKCSFSESRGRLDYEFCYCVFLRKKIEKPCQGET
jgi:hypothetical protein